MLEHMKAEVLISYESYRVVPSLDNVNLVIFDSENPIKCMTFPLRFFDKLERELSNRTDGGGTYRNLVTDWAGFRSYANNAMRYDNSVKFEEGESSPIIKLHNFIVYHGRQDGYIKIYDSWLEQSTPNDLVLPLELVDMINSKYEIGYYSLKQRLLGQAEPSSPPKSALF